MHSENIAKHEPHDDQRSVIRVKNKKKTQMNVLLGLILFMWQNK